MLNLKNKGYHCWVVNKTNMKVCLSDIFLTLQPNAVVDILDYQHSALSVEQVEKSIKSGSLKMMKDKNMIAFRSEKPQLTDQRSIQISKVTFPRNIKTNVKVEERKFKELDLDLDPNNFATENADASIEEHSPKINMRDQSNNMEYIVEGEKD